jgi:hypothetical protein
MAKEEVEALDRRMRTLRKKIEETDDIFQRKKAGDALEPNQVPQCLNCLSHFTSRSLVPDIPAAAGQVWAVSI